MSSGQSASNGNSVEPGLPKTFLMPKARNRPKVASRTLTDLPVVLAGLREVDIGLSLFRHCYHVATPFIVGWPSAFAGPISRPPAPLSLALIENSLPSNSGCTPR